MENKIFGFESEITQEYFGGKAFGLKWLFDNKIRVPETYFARVFPLENSSDFESYADSTVSALIEKSAFSKNRIAVRSSGITEDGAEESKAGNYKTKLNVHFEKIRFWVPFGKSCKAEAALARKWASFFRR